MIILTPTAKSRNGMRNSSLRDGTEQNSSAAHSTGMVTTDYFLGFVQDSTSGAFTRTFAKCLRGQMDTESERDNCTAEPASTSYGGKVSNHTRSCRRK